MTDEPIVAISAIEHFVYCPRQCALIHCDGVWSDNAHTVRGSRTHRRVDTGHHRRERGRLVLRAIPLWSETLGLSGRADAVEIERGAVRPVEYKSGVRHGSAADLQLCAQALCLEGSAWKYRMAMCGTAGRGVGFGSPSRWHCAAKLERSSKKSGGSY